MVTTGQSNGALCDSPGGVDRPETCQGFGSQLEGSQGDSTIGSFCCLTGEGQAMTWDENGVLMPSPSLTGLVDWASLHKDGLLSRCPFQFFGHWEHGRTTDDMYMLVQYGPEDTILKEPPRMMPQDFTCIPMTYNKSAPDPKPFSTELVLKTSSGYLLSSPYHENVTYFLEKNRALYMDWKLVAESLSIPISKDFVPCLPHPLLPWILPILHLCITHKLFMTISNQVTHTLGASPPKTGMDETLIGTIFAYPVSQANSQWLEELLEDGVLTFGVVEGPMQSGVRSIKELPEGVGPLPPSATEVEIASQIDQLSLKDSNPSTHIPSVPINDSVNNTEDPYAKFWDQSSEGLPYDDNSDISSYDLTPSDTVVKSARAAKIGER
ncbi:hypothetical protein BS47DRAFT_1363551 [Hydnum rufescens UP504]|uniref:Uncharacterized protein n=1 Tax=Hydnum rufescens UP504 TaxID=1448309 RepID=A0A9P6AUQ5_9AGAM|nr:hypothetical protein BS47DRAFT_1363551 [Hydnum rufescens UP504]